MRNNNLIDRLKTPFYILVIVSILGFWWYMSHRSDREHLRKIVSVEHSAGYSIVQLDDSRIFRIDAKMNQHYHKFVDLLISGRDVWITGSGKNWEIAILGTEPQDPYSWVKLIQKGNIGFNAELLE